MSTPTMSPGIAALVAMFKTNTTEAEMARVIGVLVGNGTPAKTKTSIAETPRSKRHVTQRLRDASGKFVTGRDPLRTSKLPAVSIRKMKEFCQEKGIEPVGEAWNLLCDGERRSRVLRAANKRDGLTPPDPVDPRAIKLAKAGWSDDEIARILKVVE